MRVCIDGSPLPAALDCRGIGRSGFVVRDHNGQQLTRLNSLHTHSIVRCYSAGWVWGVPAGNEKLPVAHTRRGLFVLGTANA
jgi:hypothetical protein